MTAARKIAALYVREDSIYKTLLGEEACWDEARDARKFDGDCPVIVHPPCADFCKLSSLHPRQEARASLAVVAIEQVRRHGGVLEHPAYSKLWREQNLPPAGGLADKFGGRTIQVRQFDFGHPAEKQTWLYVVRADVPPTPPRRKGKPVYLWFTGDKRHPHQINASGDGWRNARTATPRAFAEFLIAIARSAK